MRAPSIRRGALWESLTPPSAWGDPSRHALAAQGTRVSFADGVTRLCATSGLWNVPLGYGNEAVAEAVAAALREASYLSLFRSGHALAQLTAERLLHLAGADRYARVVFSTSGSAANDLVMKLARQAAALKGDPRRTVISGLHGSYHGLTYGALSLSGEALGQGVYSADRRGIRHVSPHDGGAQLRQLFAREGDRIAALVLEPVLGSGAHVLDAEFLDAVAEVRAAFDVLLVADEVATGFGRTGELFASARWPIVPDVLVLSKALSNGAAAVSAVLVAEDVCEVFDRTDAVLVHGETQAGTPASCAAVLATIDEFERIDALARARALSDALDAMIARLAAHPLVTGQRGIGCFRALELAVDGRPLEGDDVGEVVTAVRQAGALVQPGPHGIQLVPAFVYDAADLGILEEAVRTGLDASGARAW